MLVPVPSASGLGRREASLWVIQKAAVSARLHVVVERDLVRSWALALGHANARHLLHDGRALAFAEKRSAWREGHGLTWKC